MLQEIYQQLINKEIHQDERKSTIVEILFWSLCVEKIIDATQEDAANNETISSIRSEYREGFFSEAYARFAPELDEKYILIELKNMAAEKKINSADMHHFLLNKMITLLPLEIQNTLKAAINVNPLVKIDFDGAHFNEISAQDMDLFYHTITLMQKCFPSLEQISVPQQEKHFSTDVYLNLIELSEIIHVKNDFIETHNNEVNEYIKANKGKENAAARPTKQMQLFLYHHYNTSADAQVKRDLWAEKLIQPQRGWKGMPEGYQQKWESPETRWSYWEQSFTPCLQSIEIHLEEQRIENLQILEEMKDSINKGDYSVLPEFYLMTDHVKDIVTSGAILPGSIIGRSTADIQRSIYFSTVPEFNFSNTGFMFNYKILGEPKENIYYDSYTRDRYWLTHSESIPLFNDDPARQIKYIVCNTTVEKYKSLRGWLDENYPHIRILSINLLDQEKFNQYNSAAIRPCPFLRPSFS